MLSLLVIGFLACFLGILIASYGAIEAIKTVSERFKISETFIGAVFLSVGTSFPEFINSIFAGIRDRSYLVDKVEYPKSSIESFFNITGANVWQILFLAVVLAGLAIYGKKKNQDNLTQITTIFGKDSFLSWKLTCLETCFLIIVFSFPQVFSYLTTGGFNFISPIFLGVGIYYIYRTYKDGSECSTKERATKFLNQSKGSLALITLSLWTLFGLFSCVNFGISSQFDIDPSTSFGVILSFVTSSPEFSVMYFLFKQKEYQMAVSGFFGSSLFNLSLPFYSNLISMNTIFGRTEVSDDPHFHPRKIVLWLLLNLVLVVLFLLTFVRREKGRTAIVSINGVVIFILYVSVSVFLAFCKF